MCRRLIYLISFVLLLSVALTGTTKAELVGWWRFDEGSGTVANDSSGNGNDGTFNGKGGQNDHDHDKGHAIWRAGFGGPKAGTAYHK